MGLKYEYDETGVFFSYFVASVLILVLVPATIAFCKREAKKFETSISNMMQSSRMKRLPEYLSLDDDLLKAYSEEIENVKKCRAVLEYKLARSKVSFNYTGLVFLAIGWIVASLVLYSIYTNPDIEPQLWDPWQILGVSQDAQQSEVRKAYRKLSLKYHPDKAETDESDLANETDSKYIEISKAYKVLTDDDARAKWEEFGSPDGRQGFSVGIALPSWIVESANAYKVLFVYGTLFGLVLPILVSRWWSRSKKRGKGNIFNDTIQLFLTEIRSENMPLKLIVEVMCAAREFDDEGNRNCSDTGEIKNLIENVQKAVKERRDTYTPTKRFEKVAWHSKTHALLYSHLLRIPLESDAMQQDQMFVVTTTMRLLGALLQVSLSKQWGRQSFLLIRLSAMIVQAVYYIDHPLLQLPYAPPDISVHATQKKRQVTNVAKFLKMIPSERRNLFRTLSDEQFNTAMLVAQQIPVISVADASFRVVGESIIIPQCLATLIVQIKIKFPLPTTALTLGASEQAAPEPSSKVELSDKDIEAIEESDNKKIMANDKTSAYTNVHAPYFPLDKKLVLWVSLSHGGDNGDLMMMQKVADIEIPKPTDDPSYVIKNVLFKFGTPERPGEYSFRVSVRCDSYIGLDVQKNVSLTVVKPPPNFGKDDFVDDISEPDEDSIAGQLALMRGAPLAGSQTSLSKGKVPSEPKPKESNSDDKIINDDIDVDSDSGDENS